MTTEKLAVTPDQAAEALDSLDDFARMGVGVDARGPRKVLEQFIEQARAAMAATPAAPKATPEDARMTSQRAAFFMKRFLREEKLLGPNEQAALRFVIAALAATPAPGPGWQPIETAPKDRKVLVWFSDLYGGMADVARLDDDKYAKKPRPYWSGNFERVLGILAYRNGKPTHWMPLTAAPEAGQGKEADQ